MKLFPFTTSVLKDILADHKPDYTKEDLLALYTCTGGAPKYIEQFMNRGCTDMKSMVDLNYIEIQNYERLANIIKNDYSTFSGLALEMFFRQQMIESKEFAKIGSWWHMI